MIGFKELQKIAWAAKFPERELMRKIAKKAGVNIQTLETSTLFLLMEVLT